MNRFWEILLGLQRGFLSRQGDYSLQFNPHWPLQSVVGAAFWNFLLVAGAVALVYAVYRRDGHARRARVVLGSMRLALLLFLITLLNRPVIVLEQSHEEPSVIAILIDKSLSMGIADVPANASAENSNINATRPAVPTRPALLGPVVAVASQPAIASTQSAPVTSTVAGMQSRLAAAIAALDQGDQALLQQLSRQHEVRLYAFDRQASSSADWLQDKSSDDAATRPAAPDQPDAAEATPPADPAAASDVPATSDVLAASDASRSHAALASLKSDGQGTQLVESLRQVMEQMQGQRLAGVIVLTDGRETPAESRAESIEAIRAFSVKVYPVMVGSDDPPRNIEIQSIAARDTAFKGDMVQVRGIVRASGFSPDQPIELSLVNAVTGQPLLDESGKPVTQTINAGDGQPIKVELPFMPQQEGLVDVKLVANPLPGEIDDQDNARTTQVSVLNAKIAVLYVDGYPRWDYRYLKNEMIRDKTVDISCLLTSADPTFAQEGDKPIRRFPESMDELLQYDVILFGDVDPRQFTDNQLQLVSEFVARKGGGFGMVAGPRWSPIAWRNTAIEPILPVDISHAVAGGADANEGFRPVITPEGMDSGLFRFFPDKQRNEQYLKNEWPAIFWYCKGIVPKDGVGEVYAQHPTDTGPDGRKAALEVLGRFGAGRTLFSAFDDSWRWRFYTGESIFDTYWVQSLRYLAGNRKSGQRKLAFTSLQPTYQLGERVQVQLRVLDGQLLTQLPEQLTVFVTDAATQELLGRQTLMRQPGQVDYYVGSWTADRIGRYRVQLASIAAGVDGLDLPLQVIVPRLEYDHPQVNRTFLSALAAQTSGQALTLDQAKNLPRLIQSMARVVPVQTSQALWDAPLAMAIFASLICLEWVLRKVHGML